ncbi:MAG: serine/threonine protein kinase [Deltaproteobacteria bacterium]|nr:serine/threonine protein kinase [Deltaproteobacteria bacterium]
MSLAFKRGDKVHRYLVLDVLGAGAMGVVLAAYDPDLDRKIAVKLLHGGGAGAAQAEARARLLREAQAMAKLSHPNVVTVHDVGVAAGQVFVAMEYAAGSLEDWLGERRPWRAVIDIFKQAALGLAAAHDAGFVHRDFKPANVLLGKDGTARVSDFGLVAASPGGGPVTEPGRPASLAGSSALDMALTREGALMGTPYYMAPEQYLGRSADARADQYAFCVALYDALYGCLPFRGKDIEELKAAVLRGDPPAPPADAEVPNWLWDVVRQGLSLVPAERFPSMGAVIAALERDPEAERGRELARRALIQFGFDQSDAGDAKTAEQALRKALDESVAAGDRPRAAESLVRLVYVVGRQDGRSEEALALAERASQAVADGGGDQALVARLGNNRAVVLSDCGRYAEAEEALQRAIAAAEQSYGPEHGELATLLNNLGDAVQAQGRHGDALAHHQRALPIARTADDESREVANALEGLARASEDLGRHEEALGHWDEALRRWRQLLGDDNLHVVEVHSHYGWLLREVGRYDEARVHLERVVSVLEEADDPQLATALNGLASLHLDLGELDEAAALCDRAIPLCEQQVGAETVDLAHIVTNRGLVAMGRAEPEQALPDFERAAAIRARRLAEDDPDLGTTHHNLGAALAGVGRLEEACHRFAQAIAVWQGAYGADHPQVVQAHLNLGDHLMMGQAPEAAQTQYEMAFAIEQESLEPDDVELAIPLTGLASCHLALGCPAEAVPLLERAVALRRRPGSEPGPRAYSEFALAVALRGAGQDPERALALARNAVVGYREAGPVGEVNLAEVEAWLQQRGDSGPLLQ